MTDSNDRAAELRRQVDEAFPPETRVHALGVYKELLRLPVHEQRLELLKKWPQLTVGFTKVLVNEMQGYGRRRAPRLDARLGKARISGYLVGDRLQITVKGVDPEVKTYDLTNEVAIVCSISHDERT